MKIHTLILAALVTISATPAFAGRGAGGAHSNDATNVQRYNAREEEKAAPQNAPLPGTEKPAAGRDYKFEQEGYDVQEKIEPQQKPVQYNIRH